MPFFAKKFFTETPNFAAKMPKESKTKKAENSNSLSVGTRIPRPIARLRKVRAERTIAGTKMRRMFGFGLVLNSLQRKKIIEATPKMNKCKPK